ncbi:tripartite tricarboxylate transporter substrate binding protein [Acetobacteraceae bacterium H6797]|nr:tripartite tricarboxylate transporter substrate binding protein [Acetobacteraceae bacterium H6797]
MTTRRIFLAAGAATLLAAPHLRAATAWKPTRPIRLIVTYPPGGVTDIAGRISAEGLTQVLGQSVVVENRAGAGGNIGVQAAAQAEPDGYTIMLGTVALFGVNPIMYKNSGVDAVRDFQCLGTVGDNPNVLSVVPSRSKAKTVAELVAEAKARPMIVGSVGNGSSSHLSAVTFMKATGIEATHVPYRGAAPMMTAMLAGEVDFAFDTTATSTPQIRAGAIRPLAVTTAKRTSSLPEVPTLQEAGLKDYEMSIWYGLFARKDMPKEIYDALADATEKMRGPKLTERLQQSFIDPLTIPRAELSSWLTKDATRWQKIATDAGIQAD